MKYPRELPVRQGIVPVVIGVLLVMVTACGGGSSESSSSTSASSTAGAFESLLERTPTPAEDGDASPLYLGDMAAFGAKAGWVVCPLPQSSICTRPDGAVRAELGFSPEDFASFAWSGPNGRTVLVATGRFDEKALTSAMGQSVVGFGAKLWSTCSWRPGAAPPTRMRGGSGWSLVRSMSWRATLAPALTWPVRYPRDVQLVALSEHLGSRVLDIDLRVESSAADASALAAALAERHLLVFRDQQLSPGSGARRRDLRRTGRRRWRREGLRVHLERA